MRGSLGSEAEGGRSPYFDVPRNACVHSGLPYGCSAVYGSVSTATESSRRSVSKCHDFCTKQVCLGKLKKQLHYTFCDSGIVVDRVFSQA